MTQEYSADLEGRILRRKSLTLVGISCSAPELPEGGDKVSVDTDEPLCARDVKDGGKKSSLREYYSCAGTFKNVHLSTYMIVKI